MREDSGTAPGLASLPDGGGGISPLGDRFQPDLLRGTGGYAVDIACPKGPNDFRPAFTLSYSTGSGNGPFGLGWRLGHLRIERRSDRGVPLYTEDDAFVLGDAEVLVPAGGVGERRYRPQSDTKMWSIERLDEGWRIRTGDGRTLLLGQTPASRELDGARVFAWHLDEERDAAGNAIRYSYLRDRNRLYLEEAAYAIFRVRFAYKPRPDPLRNGRSGFARVTALRAGAVEIHCDRLAPTLMRSYALAYEEAQNGASLLSRVALSATSGGEVARAPELSFAYSAVDFTAWDVREIRAEIAPPSLDDPAAQLVDLTGDGLPDVLQSSGSRMLLWRNAGDGSLAGPTAVAGVPSTVSLARGNVAFADLDGDGRVDLFAVDQPLQLAFTADGRGGFAPEPIVFRDHPSLRLDAADTRLMDVDGDGVTDLLATGRGHFLLFRHLPGRGWQEPQAVARIADLQRFPDVSFADLGVQLADMTGDGLQDLVAVRSGDVSYWPYLGHGAWGDRVRMENPPRFPPGYRDDRVQVVDLDGDGGSDVVYFDAGRTLLWLNRSGAGFAPPIEIPVAPRAGRRVLAADFFGDGRAGFLWTAGAAEGSAGYRFLRFDAGRRPYVMTAIENGMGRRTEIDYTSTAVMRREDQAADAGWSGSLPFAVPVVSEIRDRDAVAGGLTRLTLRYRDGIYDGQERELRGFTRVAVEMAGDDSIPASRQEYTFFQGDPDEPDLAARKRQRALAGSLQSLRAFELTAGGFELRHESFQSWDARAELDLGDRHVFFPFLTASESREHSAGAAPARVERTRYLDYDAHGNAGRRLRECFFDGDPPARVLATEERFVYTADEDAWLVKLPVRSELRDGAGLPFTVKLYSYDGAPFVGLPEGQADRGLLTRTRELALLPARLPADYLAGRDLTALGYELAGAGDTRGFYATTFAVRRDGRGNVVEQRDPLGAAEAIAYDADGVFPVEKRDARGKVTALTFDPRSGEPSRVTRPDGRTFRFATDPLGRTVAQLELDDAGAEQVVKAWQIDSVAVPVSVTSLAPGRGGHGLADLLAADPAALPAALADVAVARQYLDGFGKTALTVATAPDQPGGPGGPGGAHRLVASGRTLANARKMVSAEFPAVFVPDLAFLPPPDPATASRRHRYDGLGNLLATAGPGPVRFRVVRDTATLQHFEGASAGDFAAAAAPAGPPTRIERFDARDRVVRIEEAVGDGTAIATGYDLTVDGRIEVLRDDAGAEVARYSFAGPGEPVRIAHRDAGSRTYYRDAAGRIAELVRADGSRLLYRYDAGGRLLRLEHADAAGAVSLLREVFYDADPGAPAAGRFLAERVALLREGDREVRYSYNRAGNLVREEVGVGGTTLATAWERDLRQRPTAVVYPDGHRLVYRLDASGAVQEIPGVVAGVAYTEEGELAGYTLANGVAVALPRDAVSRRLAGVSASRGGALLRSLAYTYDEIGNIAGLRDEVPGAVEHQTFTYDGLYRLTGSRVHAGGAAGPLLRSEDYTYDTGGNLLQLGALSLAYADARHPGRTTAVVHGAERQAVEYGGRGAVRAWGALAAVEYDPLDRLVRAVRDIGAGGAEIEIAYDPLDRRLRKRVTTAGVATTVLYAGSLYELHPAHGVRHVYLGSRLVASEEVRPAAVRAAFFVADHHGTILLATDAAGAVLQAQRYAPFGLAVDGGVALDRYLGYERDAELGLLQLGARWYAPALGRFLSPDWYVLENPTKPMRMPQGFNVYSYALNNPLVFKDPSGKWFFLAAFAVGFVTGLIYGLADGQKWDAFGTALETGLTVGFGVALGGGIFGGFGEVMGGVNGLFTGLRKTYSHDIEGLVSFASDSTWGLVGTSIGNALNVVNLIAAPSSYRSDLSERQNRQVYDKGFRFQNSAAFTQGNVISNLQGGGGAGILRHESVHIFQNRLLGNIYVFGYVAWVANTAYYAFWLGVVLWPFTGEDPISAVRDVVYDDNPFELWAYSVQGSDGGKLAL